MLNIFNYLATAVDRKGVEKQAKPLINKPKRYLEMEKATQQERLLQVKEVAQICGIGVSTVWRNSKSGMMPKPIKVSANTTRWRLSEINAWLENPSAWGGE